LANSKTQNAFLFTVNAIFRHDYPLAVEPGCTPMPLVQTKSWRDSLPIDMLISAVSFLVVAQSSSEIQEGLMNNSVSQEECARLREGVPYVKVYRYNPKHLCPNLNGYGDNGQRKVWSCCGSTHCTCQLTNLSLLSLRVVSYNAILQEISNCTWDSYLPRVICSAVYRSVVNGW